jgi:hypothetical protein
MTRLALIMLFVIFGLQTASAQISLQVYDYRPTGILGFVMKPLVTAELGYMGSFEDSRWRTAFNFTYLSFKQRQDTFFISGVLHDYTTTVTPGYERYPTYNMFQVGASADFAFVQKDNWALYVGAGIIAGLTHVVYEDKNALEDSHYDGGGLMAGFRGKLGGEYSFTDHITVFLEAQRSYLLVTEPAALFSSNNYGLGMRYDF